MDQPVTVAGEQRPARRPGVEQAAAIPLGLGQRQRPLQGCRRPVVVGERVGGERVQQPRLDRRRQAAGGRAVQAGRRVTPAAAGSPSASPAGQQHGLGGPRRLARSAPGDDGTGPGWPAVPLSSASVRASQRRSRAGGVQPVASPRAAATVASEPARSPRTCCSRAWRMGDGQRHRLLRVGPGGGGRPLGVLAGADQVVAVEAHPGQGQVAAGRRRRRRPATLGGELDRLAGQSGRPAEGPAHGRSSASWLMQPSWRGAKPGPEGGVLAVAQVDLGGVQPARP